MRIYFCNNKDGVLITNHVPNLTIGEDVVYYHKQLPFTRATSGNKGISVFHEAIPPIPEGKIIALDVIV